LALVQGGEVEETQAASFKRIYEKAWIDLVQGGLGTPFHNAPAGAALVVTTGDSLTTISPSAKAVVYVQGGQEQLAAQLLTNLTLPVLTVGSRIESAVTSLLAAHFPCAKAVSTVKVGIIVDGQPYQPCADSPPLIDAERSWLKELVVLSIEFRARLPAQRSDQSIRSVLGRLGRIHCQLHARVPGPWPWPKSRRSPNRVAE
jgi:hypothetical protein